MLSTSTPDGFPHEVFNCSNSFPSLNITLFIHPFNTLSHTSARHYCFPLVFHIHHLKMFTPFFFKELLSPSAFFHFHLSLHRPRCFIPFSFLSLSVCIKAVSFIYFTELFTSFHPAFTIFNHSFHIPFTLSSFLPLHPL